MTEFSYALLFIDKVQFESTNLTTKISYAINFLDHKSIQKIYYF